MYLILSEKNGCCWVISKNKRHQIRRRREKLWLWYGYSRIRCSREVIKHQREYSWWNNPQKTIYEVIENDYFEKSKVKSPKEFLTKFRTEYNAPQFIPHEVKNKIQQIGLKNVLFLHILNIKTELVVVVEKSSKEKSEKTNSWKRRVINKKNITKGKHYGWKRKMTEFKFEVQTER